MRNLSAGHDYLLIRKQCSLITTCSRESIRFFLVLPNKLFDSAKLLRRWFTFLRLRVDGEAEPSREPETSASKSAVLRGLLFSMVQPEAYRTKERRTKSLINVTNVVGDESLPLVQVLVMTSHHSSSVLEMAYWWNCYLHHGYQRDLWFGVIRLPSTKPPTGPARYSLRHGTCSPSWREALETLHPWEWRSDAYHIVEIAAPIMNGKDIYLVMKSWQQKLDLRLTEKYGLHAERTTLCAFRNFPSAANVQSTRVSLSNNVSNTAISVLWWLFHRRQNCWSSSMFEAGWMPLNTSSTP